MLICQMLMSYMEKALEKSFHHKHSGQFFASTKYFEYFFVFETSGRLEGVKRKRSNHCIMPPLTKRRKHQRPSHVTTNSILEATPNVKRPARPSPTLSPVVTFGVAFQEDVLEEVLRLTHERAAELLQDEEMVDWVASYPYNIHKEHQPDHMREILNDALLLISRNQRAPKFVLTVYRDAAFNIIDNSQVFLHLLQST